MDDTYALMILGEISTVTSAVEELRTEVSALREAIRVLTKALDDTDDGLTQAIHNLIANLPPPE